MNKICKNCNVDKDIKEFYNGRNSCKKCCYESTKKYKDNINYKEYQKDYHIKCKDNGKKKQYSKIDRTKNKVKIKEYRDNNKEKNVIYSIGYIYNKRNTDMLYNLKHNIACIIRAALKKKGYIKNDKTLAILGSSIEDFKIYFEKQFESWMTWENHGIYTGQYNETWQIDHIEPISTGLTEQEIIKLNHYTNLRPLCSRLNLEKSNKIG